MLKLAVRVTYRCYPRNRVNIDKKMTSLADNSLVGLIGTISCESGIYSNLTISGLLYLTSTSDVFCPLLIKMASSNTLGTSATRWQNTPIFAAPKAKIVTSSKKPLS